MKENQRITDTMTVALDRARALSDGTSMVGWGVATLRGPDGAIKECQPFANLVTNRGDQYYALMGAAGVGTPAAAAPTLVNGMKLGTGTTAAAKSSAGANIVTYITDSNNAFDSAYPAVAAVGTDVGYNVTYQSTWAAGDSTNSAITEVVICDDQATNAAPTAVANVISRAIISAVNKAAGDSLTITWNHKFLGA